MEPHQNSSSSFLISFGNPGGVAPTPVPRGIAPSPVPRGVTPSPVPGGSGSRAPPPQRFVWSTAEDLVLISAWLNTSKDPLTGNEQKGGTFWKRITTTYNNSPKVVGLAKRELSHCKQRWGKINEGVNKFVGAYEAATKQRTSGQSEDDVLKAAHEIYINAHERKFALEHAWRELKNDQKWRGSYGSSQQSSGSKRKRVGEEESMPSVNDASVRPIGVKAAKAKGKRAVDEEGKNLLEVLAAKEKVNKSKLLDSLLTRTEPLTSLEVALKDKLITEMLSMGTNQPHPQMEARKSIVCGLSAGGLIPPLQQDDDVAENTPQEVEVVEISDDEEDDLVELSRVEFRANMGYLTRVEEPEEDIAPEFRRMVKRMREEEKKMREEKYKVWKAGIKLEEGEGSRTH